MITYVLCRSLFFTYGILYNIINNNMHFKRYNINNIKIYYTLYILNGK